MSTENEGQEYLLGERVLKVDFTRDEEEAIELDIELANAIRNVVVQEIQRALKRAMYDD